MLHAVLDTWTMTWFSEYLKFAGRSSMNFLGDPKFQTHIDILFSTGESGTLILGLFSSFNNQVQPKENIILKQYAVVHVKWPFPNIQNLELVGHTESTMV